MTRRRLACAAALAAGLLAPAALAADVTFSVMESGTYNKAAADLAPEFKAATGYTLGIAAFPWAILRQNNTTDLLTGAGQYQVMSGGYYLADVYDYFAPVGDLVARDRYTQGMIPGLEMPGKSEFNEGQQIGVPYGVDSYGLLVNTDILGQAGVAAPFRTWTDVEAACAKIEAAVRDVACLAHSTGNPEQIGAFFFSGYDGPYVTADGKYALDAGKAAAAAAELPKLWRHLPRNGAAMSFDEAGALFRDGKAAMLVDWPSFVSNSLDDEASAVKGKWQQVPFPGGGFPWLSLWNAFIPKTAPDREAAWAWVKLFAGPDHARGNYLKHNIGSVWLALYEDPELKARHAHQWPAQVADFSRAKNPPLSGEAQDFLTSTLQDVANGRMPAAAAIASVNQKWASIPVPPALAGAARSAGLAAK